MGALRGSMTFTKFFVVGKLADEEIGALVKRVRTQVFKPLDPDEDTLERAGWASVLDPFDLEINAEAISFNEFLTMSFRMDRWVIPGPLLKSHLREAEQKLMERKSLERLGKRATAEVKEAVIKKLRKQLVPAMKSIDFVWDRNANLAFFYSHSKRHRELVQELFDKTFKVQLLIQSPGTLADHVGMSAERAKAFASLEETSLATLSGKAMAS